MSKVRSIKAVWVFFLVTIAPGAMIMAEDPPSAREAQPAAVDGSDVALGQEFRLFKPVPAPSVSTEAQAKAAAYGIVSTAATAGGKFTCVGASGVAYLGYGEYGIDARGNTAGGIFIDLDGGGTARAGYGTTGVQGDGAIGVRGYGSAMGGFFQDSDSSGYANVGEGEYGIRSFGNLAGGYFQDLNNSGRAYVGYGDIGISAQGTTAGGYFQALLSSGYAYVGYGHTGIDARGNTVGGIFTDADSGGTARAGYGTTGVQGDGVYGVRGYGSVMGGYFEDSNGSGYANVGTGGTGIESFGNTEGGYFYDLNSSGFARVAFGNYGIAASGDLAGGYFSTLPSSTIVRVAYSSYKIQGNGTMAFVQNHPYDRDSVIVYAAPEGDEVATYTRGTARLVGGEARVPLGETFRWVTNPDLGLTAYLTPVGEWCDLYVAEQATDSIVVRSRDGSGCSFNYIVYGLRIGFEESSIVQEKEQEAYIPSMTDHRQLYERRPELKSYSSLERFKAMRRAAGQKDEIDLSRAHALRDAIVEFDPAVHELPGIHERPEPNERVASARSEDVEAAGAELGPAVRDDGIGPAIRVARTVGAAVPMDAEGNVYATSFRPSSQDLASLVTVSEIVEPGDVLVIDRDSPGLMRKSFEGSDTGVIGVVALDAGVVLGTRPPSSRISGLRDVEMDGPASGDSETVTSPSHRAAVALAGVVTCKVDADYGAIWPGDLLVTSPTPGHAMRADAPLPGTMLGKALEPLEEGVGTIKVLVMLR